MSLAELLVELALVKAAIRALLLGVPLKGTVGRTEIDLKDNLAGLRVYRDELLSDVKAERRRLGQLGPRRRTVY